MPLLILILFRKKSRSYADKKTADGFPVVLMRKALGRTQRQAI